MADHTTPGSPGGGPIDRPPRDPERPLDQTTNSEERRAARETKESARELVEDAASTAKARAHEVKEEARSWANDARAEAERSADRWTTAAGHRAESIARALRAAADRFRQDGEESMADLTNEGADQVQRISGYLGDENPAAMMHDLEDSGRSNPAFFLGTAFTLGMMGGRFLRASSPERTNGRPGTAGSRTDERPAKTRYTRAGEAPYSRTQTAEPFRTTDPLDRS